MTHHEKWDGSGYPLGTRGEEIPLSGRIVAICDVFDALTSERPYKPAYPEEKALTIIRDGAGSHFDPAVYEAFGSCFEAIRAVRAELSDGLAGGGGSRLQASGFGLQAAEGPAAADRA